MNHSMISMSYCIALEKSILTMLITCINHQCGITSSNTWWRYFKKKSFFSKMCRWKVLPFVTCAIDQLNGKCCLPATELIGKWLTHRWIFYGCITNRDRLSPWVPNQRPSIIMWTKDIKACLQYFHFLCRKSGYHVKPLKVQETKKWEVTIMPQYFRI